MRRKNDRFVSIVSDGIQIGITNEKIREMADELGIYLGKEYWYRKSDEKEYRTKEVEKNLTSIGKMVAHLRMTHFTQKRVFAFRRKYGYENFGNKLCRAQKVICFDIDGHKGEDTKAAVLVLISMFPKIKFIEFSPDSNGYHVYIEFETPVMDYALKNLKNHFEKQGINIDPILSSGHIRFPFSSGYDVYGYLDLNRKTLVSRKDIDSILRFWEDSYTTETFDPTFEAVFKEEKSPKKTKRERKKNSSDSLKQKLIENTELDYHEGERHHAVNRILFFCVRYHLDEDAFTDICIAHDKGARGTTDYHRLYEWGLTHFPSTPVAKKKTDYTTIFERVDYYAKDTVLPENIVSWLENEMDRTLIPFLKTRKNLCSSGEFKNEAIIRHRYGAHVREVVEFIFRYLFAHKEEQKARKPILILPMVFPAMVGEIPMPLDFIKALGKHLHMGCAHEVKVYLESIKWLRPVVLNEGGATYAEGRCIYYTLHMEEPKSVPQGKRERLY